MLFMPGLWRLTFIELDWFGRWVSFGITGRVLFRLLVFSVHERRSVIAAAVPASLSVAGTPDSPLIVKVLFVVVAARLVSVVRWVPAELICWTVRVIAENLWIFLRCHRRVWIRICLVNFHISTVCLFLVCVGFRERSKIDYKVHGKEKTEWLRKLCLWVDGVGGKIDKFCHGKFLGLQTKCNKPGKQIQSNCILKFYNSRQREKALGLALA